MVLESPTEVPCAIAAPRRPPVWPLAASVLVYAVLACFLAYTKAPWSDEAWFANPAYNLAFHGRMATNLLEPSGHFLNAYLRGIHERTYVVVPNHLIALAAWFRLFGATPFAMRVYSIIWGVLSLAGLFYVLLRLFPDPWVARLGTLLTAIDFIFLWATADGRMEASVYALSLCAMASYLYFRERNYTTAVGVSQCLGAAASFTHPNALLFMLGITVLAIRFDRQRLRARHLFLAAIPYISFAAAWAVYIAQSPRDWAAQFLANAAGRDSSRWKMILQPWRAVWFEILRHFGSYVASGLWAPHMNEAMLFVPLFYAAALVWLSKNRKRPEISSPMLVTLTITLVLGMTFLNGFKAPIYLIYLVPLYDAILAAWILALWRRTADCKLIAAALTAGFVILQLSTSIQHIRRDEYHTYYRPAAQDVEHRREAGQTIVAGSSLGFGMDFDGFADDARMGMYSGLKPDVLVVDRSYRVFASVFEREEPHVFLHVVNTLTTRYRLAKCYGPFWIFERLPEPIPSPIATRYVGDLKDSTSNRRGERLFEFLSGTGQSAETNPYL